MASLVVDVYRAPKNSGKVAQETARLIHGILSQFEYTGKWYITLTTQLTRRVNFKFQVIGRRGVGIACRTKPGDNGTCWEVIIEPPKGYLLDKVHTDLRMVPPDGKMKQTTSKRLETIASLPPEVVPTLFKALSTPIVKNTVQEELPKESTNKKVVDWNTPIQNLKKLPEPEIKAPPVPAGVKLEIPNPIVPLKIQNQEIPNLLNNSQKSFLSIIEYAHSNIERIGENSSSINSALIAICMGVNPEDGSIQRQLATKILVQELDLIKFTEASSVYTDYARVVSLLLKNLVQKGYLARWTSTARKDERVRDTTRGYVLTPNGRVQLNLLKDKLPIEIKNRLFKPELLKFQTSNKDLEIIAEEKTPTLNLVSQDKIGDMQNMFAQFEKCKNSIKEWQDLTNEYQLKQIEIQEKINIFDKKINELNKEKEKLNQEIVNLKNEKSKIDEELKISDLGKQEEMIEFEKIKNNLQSLLK